MSEQKINILLVDDRPDGLLALEAVLDAPEYHLVKASSGPEALSLLEGQDYAVILLDVQMPRMDGFETAKLIKQRPGSMNIPIIFITAINKDPRYVYQGYGTGAVDYLFKPFDSYVLKSKVAVFAELFQKNLRIQQQSAEIFHLNKGLERRVAERTVSLMKRSQELSRSNEELEQFANVVAHDLQEPLRKVQMFGDRLKAQCGGTLNAEALDSLNRVQSAAERMQALIQDVLKYSRAGIEALSLQRVDLSQVVREVLRDLEASVQEAQGRVEVSDLPVIDADSVQMRQLFQNLIGNALKFHRSGIPSMIQVRGEVLNGHSHFGEPLCRITVEDNGIGFDERHLGRIFTIFQRLHDQGEYQGFGVGLAICRRIVRRHAGEITAQSVPGRGSTFIVMLPVAQRREEAPAWAQKQ
jgi:signal transduction histidine kinase